MGKNRHHMDTSSDTSKEKILNASFFPDELRGKKLKEDFQLRESKEPLELYLEAEDPKHLFKAISANNNLILQGSGIPETYLRYNNIEYVDAYTIVWVSIYHWQWLHIRHRGRDKIVKEAERLLINIGRSLIPHDIKDYSPLSCGNDYFVHRTPHWKGSDTYITYNNAKSFIEYWDKIYQSFKKRKKMRYKTVDKSLIDQMSDEYGRSYALIGKMYKGDTQKIDDLIKKIKDELKKKITIDEIKRFDISSISKQTASFIACDNEKNCSLCKENALKRKRKKVAYKTFLNLHKNAIKKLNP